jgi:hypothetical protein
MDGPVRHIYCIKSAAIGASRRLPRRIDSIEEEAMKSGTFRKAAVLAAGLVLAVVTIAAAQDKGVPKSLVRFADESLVKLGADDRLVAAVEAQTKKGVSLDKIKELDAAWMAEKGINAFMRGLLDNSNSGRLKQLIGAHAFILEAFVMDNQGALVGLTNKTSDYWQGDEAKFTESYKGGQGAVHYGKAEFDKSANATLVQISVPVVKAGKAIGAITFGISIDAWEKR